MEITNVEAAVPVSAVVDLDRWRAQRPVVEDVEQAAPEGDDREAELLHLPAAAQQPAQQRDRSGGQPGQPPVRSVFGPVMAFGLVRREPPARPAAVGEDEAVTPRVRAIRQRHLRDARGASRGPGR